MAMFNNQRVGRDADVEPQLQPVPVASSGERIIFSVIGPDVVITGNIAATTDLHIEGRIDGDVDCGSLVQGNDSIINGTVKAESARLAGTITGSVSVRQLTIERAARITGDVEYESISIEAGAAVDGGLKHIAADAAGRAARKSAAAIVPARNDDVLTLSVEASAAA